MSEAQRRRYFSTCVCALAIAATFTVCSAAARAATAPSGPFVMDAVRTDTPPPMVASIAAPQWQKAHSVTLDWNFTFHRPAKERTTAYLLYDAHYVYVAAVAEQKTEVIATQHTNNVGDDLDDNISVQFWPSGATGIRYKFTATAIGTRYQESSENDSYSPQWDAVGHIGDGGFTVVMRIPLDVMRSDGRAEWRLNFHRLNRKTGESDMWATDPNATEDDQGQYVGYLRGMGAAASGTKTRPRLALYQLAAIGSAAAGGSTSRMGVDLALPITRTTSLLATAHPDYSNVELDQQAVAPTEFPRVLQEIRPFFTQGANYYNRFDQVGNTQNIMLYTPSIVTPRVGVAIAGLENGAGFAAFNSVATGNTDAANALFWSSADKRVLAGYQRAATSQPGLYDVAQAGTVRYDNLVDFFTYASYGADRGTNVTDPSAGTWQEAGAGYYSPTSRLAAAVKKIGEQYSPVDGIVDHPGIAGYAVDGTRHIDFGTADWLQAIDIFSDLERYHGSSGRLDQGDQSVDISIAARNLFRLDASTGSHFLGDRFGNGGMFDENQVGLNYNADGVTPTSFFVGRGRFDAGYLRTAVAATALRAGSRGIIDFESDSARYTPDTGIVSDQNLIRVAFTMQLSHDDSFTAGVRRVTGVPPAVGAGIQIHPGSNVSFAFHHCSGGSELYFVYGNPNADVTFPVLTLKLIEYVGAQKGS